MVKNIPKCSSNISGCLLITVGSSIFWSKLGSLHITCVRVQQPQECRCFPVASLGTFNVVALSKVCGSASVTLYYRQRPKFSVMEHFYLSINSMHEDRAGILGAGKSSQSAQWCFYLGINLICCKLMAPVLKQPACSLLLSTGWSKIWDCRISACSSAECLTRLNFSLTDSCWLWWQTVSTKKNSIKSVVFSSETHKNSVNGVTDWICYHAMEIHTTVLIWSKQSRIFFFFDLCLPGALLH